MDIQTVPIAPDVEYFLDHAAEDDNIDAGTRMICQLYAPRATLAEIVDDGDPDAPFVGFGAIRRVSAKIIALADEINKELPTERRNTLVLMSLAHMRNIVHKHAWYYAFTSIEDTIIGGNHIDHKTPRNKSEWRRMERFEPSPRQRRRLYSPAWIRRTAKRFDETPILRARTNGLLRRIERGPFDWAAAKAGYEDLSNALDEQRVRYRLESERRLRAYLAETERPITLPRRNQIEARKVDAKARRTIVRAARTAESVLGREAVSTFARGEPVRLVGETLQLEVSRTGSSAMMGHSGLHVAAVDKAGSRLANMCIYYEQTPALDQLTALGLGMMAGEEAEIINTANLSLVTDEGRAHPLIAQRMLKRTPQRATEREHQLAMQENYWRSTRDLWTEPTGIAVMGDGLWRVLGRIFGPLPEGSGHHG